MRYQFILSDLRPGFCQAVLAKYQKKTRHAHIDIGKRNPK